MTAEFPHRFAPGDRVEARLDIWLSALVGVGAYTDRVVVPKDTRGVVETTAVYDSDVCVGWTGGLHLFVREALLRLAE